MTAQRGGRRPHRRLLPRPPGALAAAYRVLVGRPLRIDEGSKEQITPVEGLSALSLDALTSVAYGPEAIVVVLAAAGSSAVHLALPITGTIVGLLALLVFSYRQVIDAYPGGGGAYAVSRENLGAGAAQLAAASLVVDYTLTVAVSIAAGVASLTSAYPALSPAAVPIGLGILALITLVNLRGLAEGARAFLLPTLLFIVGLFAIIAVGLIHPLALHAQLPGRAVVPTHGLETVGVLLILKAFASGCSALTGVEAIANGVPLFREPRVVRAKRTELLLGTILGAMLLGLAILVQRFHIEPRRGQTVLSQIMAVSVGRHWVYFAISLTITIVLALAANTSFGGLPVLASLLARDDYLPHPFAVRGDRLVFNNGVIALAVLSGALLIAANGNTDSLIPLFAIGVFIGFTLAQGGLVVHWARSRCRFWGARAALNGLGATVTGVSTVIFLVSKFTEGAWVVVVTVPLLIVMFHRVRAYYRRTGRELGLGQLPAHPEPKRTLVIVPVVNISRLTERAISEALSLGDEVIAVTVAFDDPGGPSIGPSEPGSATAEGTAVDDIERRWREWDPGVPLEVLHSEYSSVSRPIVEFIDRLLNEREDQLVVLIPVVVPRRLRYRALHNHLDVVLSSALRRRPSVVVARVELEVAALGDSPANSGS